VPENSRQEARKQSVRSSLRQERNIYIYSTRENETKLLWERNVFDAVSAQIALLKALEFSNSFGSY